MWGGGGAVMWPCPTGKKTERRDAKETFSRVKQ